MDILAEFDARIRQGYSVSDALDELMEITPDRTGVPSSVPVGKEDVYRRIVKSRSEPMQPIRVYDVPRNMGVARKSFYDASTRTMHAHMLSGQKPSTWNRKQAPSPDGNSSGGINTTTGEIQQHEPKAWGELRRR